MALPELNSNGDHSIAERLDRAIEWLLIALLAFMPLTFGAVEAWSEQMVVILAAAISVCFLLTLILRGKTALIWSWAYVPVGLFILVAAIQLIPLPASVAGAISWNTLEIKNRLLGDPVNGSEGLKSITISFYSYATKQELRKLLAVAAVFCVVLNVYRRQEQVKRLLAAISIIGGSVAVLGIIQRLSGTDKIFWTIPTNPDKYWFGTFLLHSHYSQFMNLSIGATLALLLVKLQEIFSGQKITPVLVVEYLWSPAARNIWLMIGVIIIGISTVFLSLSRGGMISLLVSGSFTTLLLTSRKSIKGSGWAVAVVGLCAFMCVLYVGFDAVYDRLGTLSDLREVSGGRLEILKNLSLSFQRFPVLGTGLGTHEVVYPMFDRSTVPALAAHAENEYAQAAEETGLIGLGILVGFGVIIGVNYVRNIRSVTIPIRSAAYGLGFGLIAVLIHSLSDFGQHLPANAMLSAIFCALMVSISRMERHYTYDPNIFRASRIPKSVRIGVLAFVSLSWLVVIVDANKARAAETYWRQALMSEEALEARQWAGTNDEYRALIISARSAAEKEPDNIKYRHWLNVYRWRSISRVTDPNTGETIMTPETAEFTRQIIKNLKDSLVLCPTYGPTHCVIGQLEKFVLDEPSGADSIRKGYELAPYDPTTCFVAGYLDTVQGKLEDSYKKFERAIELDGSLFKDIANIYIYDVNRPDLAIDIADENPWNISYVANVLAEYDGESEIAKRARERVTQVLKSRCDREDAAPSVYAALGYIHVKNKEYQDAIECFRQALILDYGQLNWRMTLARVLDKVGRTEEAVREANVCLHLDPDMKSARDFINEISHRGSI